MEFQELEVAERHPGTVERGTLGLETHQCLVQLELM